MHRLTHFYPISSNIPTPNNMFTHVHFISQRQLDQRCERSRSSSQCHRPLKQILHLDEYLRLAKLPRQMDRVFVSCFAMSLLIGAVWYKAGNQSIFSHASMRPAFRIYVMSDGGLDFSALCAKVCQHDHFRKSQKPMRRSSPLSFFLRVALTQHATQGCSKYPLVI